MAEKVKVLLVSHLATNDTNNVGKTLLNIFDGFKKEELCQLYFNPIPPNVDKCMSWYSITDDQALKSLWGSRAGTRVAYESGRVEEKSNTHKKYAGKTTLKLLLRDIIWKFARINYKDLYLWVEEMNPSVVFCAPGASVFAYRITLNITKKYNIPLVLFLMDDFYNEKKNNSFLERLRFFWIRSAIRSALCESSKIYSVSDLMADDYGLMCGKKIDTLYTPIHVKDSSKQIYGKKANLKFVYAGSLGLGRWEVLKQIGLKLNDLYPFSKLYVYCSPDYEAELLQLSNIQTIEYGGFVSSSRLSQIVAEADVVLHVESFDQKQALRTRYSVSTKVPECLQSGKIFLAVGPTGQAGLEYLKKYDAAIVCNTKEEVDQAIRVIHQDSFDYSERFENGRNLLMRNHSSEAVLRQLKSDILKIINR